MNPNDHHRILVKQRLNRPLSPHLGIYKWQITSVNSALTRITGLVCAGAFYIFGIAYLTAPLFSWHMDSMSLAAAFGALPIAAKVVTKFALAWPLAFHSFNGLRYLTWDTARLMTNKQVIRTGWMAVGISTASALALATLY
jgi:succinate dehydrogenase (ubiquinone) cytochrome b560 subunit